MKRIDWRERGIIAACVWRERVHRDLSADWLERWLSECSRCRVFGCEYRLHRVRKFPVFDGDAVLDRSGRLWELVSGNRWICRGVR